MHWFGGTIAEAVSLSKQRKAIFVVFVEGDNQPSKDLAATIDDREVIKRLADQSQFLAVKLKSGSENYTYFAQIYQFVPVPSLFFIGRNGTPLEVVCAGIQAPSLAERIDRILEQYYKGEQTVKPSTSRQNIQEETTNLLQSEAAHSVKTAAADSEPTDSETVPKITASGSPGVASAKRESDAPQDTDSSASKIPKTYHEVTNSGQEYDVVCDGDVCVRKPRDKEMPGPSRVDANDKKETTTEQTPSDVSNEETPSEVSNEEKVGRAIELLEARRREKEEKEKELEKQKELERRAIGQGVAELKKWQADQELKQIQEERKREKLENNLARQRILEQIAQDRAERKAREQQPLPAPQTPSPTVITTFGDGSVRARVQFKLSDGESHTAHFEPSATLDEVHRYVADNLQMTRSSFSLWTAFPRRELTENDATLRDLQLVPSAALLVLPRRVTVATTRNSSFSSIVEYITQLFSTFIMDPAFQLYNWLLSRVWGTPAVRARSSSPNPRGPRNPTNPTIRRRGNVHRLNGDRPSDDENNTWNGNSTQQM
ncbi:unnamed protein product [Leptidea sinapis]|uniref:UBX domain-containing protein 4 n=1 Tax=Leptidea sinapis TaxID=189913 RepID=A0A5E4QI84_9NEOP|nr:unnamed protein product [Leptidea sinapis]